MHRWNFYAPASLLGCGLFFWLLGLPSARAEEGPRDTRLTQTFTRIWRSNFWDHPQSRSGPGSALDATRAVRIGIEQLIEDFGIDSILDVACGDFGWISQLNLGGAHYTGLDIVPDLIEEIKAEYGQKFPDHVFGVADMTFDPLPQADLVLARDVIGHLSFSNAMRALSNIRASGAKWLLTTTFLGDRSNHDIRDGQWRPVDLSKPPYSLGPPVYVIIEHCREHGGMYSDKALGLWPTSRITP